MMAEGVTSGLSQMSRQGGGDVTDGCVDDREQLEAVAGMTRAVAREHRRPLPQPERAAKSRSEEGVARGVLQRGDERAHRLGRARFGAGVPRPRERPARFARIDRHGVRRE